MTSADGFTYHGVDLDYADDAYNSTRLNERAVEIPVARSFLAGRRGPGLEVGNVLGHYGVEGHRVVDRYEEAAGVEALDVLDVEGRYRWIVSISTIEHVRWDPPEDRDEAGAEAALAHLRTLLTPAGRLLVTIPIGWHPPLDAAIRAGSLGADREVLYVRGRGDGWVVGDPRRDAPPYGLSTPWAEAVYVAEFGR